MAEARQAQLTKQIVEVIPWVARGTHVKQPSATPQSAEVDVSCCNNNVEHSGNDAEICTVCACYRKPHLSDNSMDLQIGKISW